MKNKIVKICKDYNWNFKGKTSKGWTVENNLVNGNIITSPTLEGLYNCMQKWIVEKENKNQ